MRQFKLYSAVFLGTVLLITISFFGFDYLKNEREDIVISKNNAQAQFMRDNLESLIEQKQKSTLSIALTLSNDKALAQDISQNSLNIESLKSLIQSYKKYTLYKNVWIQILDKDATSLYRSWSSKKGDNLLNIRKDLKELVEKKEILSSVSVGKFDLSIKAIVPIFDNNEFVGIIEVISHFNSIAKQLKVFDTQSVVLLQKEYKEQLKYPFTKMFLGEHYIANFNAPEYERQYLQEKGIDSFFNNSHKVQDGYIIVSYELLGVNNKVLGYYIMFKRENTLPSLDIDFFMFKTISSFVITLMALAIVFSSVMFIRNKKQRKYYKKIIDSSSNIVAINNKKELKAINKVFFKYFSQYKSLEEFKNEHSCLCDFFVQEDGYLAREMDGKHWIDHLVLNSDIVDTKVKMDIEGKIYFFSINASLVSEELERYSVVLTDITRSENYKIELEKLTITDSLTEIGNRRYFNQKLKEEISRARRYEHELALIMLDIDHFKKINDNFGHDVGDEVLKEYTKMISSDLREGDVFCRIGGEEFMIILPHVSSDNGIEIAQKFRKEVEESKKILPITMSFGVTEYIKGEDASFMLKRVDSALYEAKNNGRNRVVFK